MERILSKDEIAELLSALHEGEIEAEIESPDAPEEDRPVARLDLLRGSASGRFRVANFDIILDSFARHCSISLANRLQRSVVFKRIDMQTIEFDPLLQGLKGFEPIGIVRLDPLASAGLFIFDSALSFSMIEVLLGGSTEGDALELDRPMTSIELNIIHGVMKDASQDLQKAFRPLEELQTSLLKIETNPRMVNIVAPDTEVLLTKFEISVDKVKGELSLVIPYFCLEPLREKLKEGLISISSGKPSWAPSLGSYLINMDVEVEAQIGEVSLLIRDILNFKEGDIIDLSSDPNAPLRVLVEQKPKFFAMAGIRNGKKAIRITSRLTQGENNGNG